MTMTKTFYFKLKEPTLYTNTAKVEITFKDGTFSAMGSISNECCGQCLDEISQRIQPNTTFDTIYRLWQLYHLNDMHPECVHQHKLGWVDDAKTQVVVREYFITYETSKKCDEIKNKILDFAKQQKPYIPTDEECTYLNLKSYITTYDEELNDPRYKLHKTENKTRGWLSIDETPLGLLCKPCPVCNYKYGTSWIKFEIPAEDTKIILELLGE